MKSIFARKSNDISTSSKCGLRKSVNSVRIRIISRCSSFSNSLMRLFASTTCEGSINTVLPDADSSCTIPFIFLLNEGLTGITNRPSLMLGVTSLSTMPSACAARKMEFKVLEIPLNTDEISRLMALNCGDALSFICP